MPSLPAATAEEGQTRQAKTQIFARQPHSPPVGGSRTLSPAQDYFENTTPCAMAEPVQRWGHVRWSKSKPGLSFWSWKAVSIAKAPEFGSKRSRNRRSSP